MAVSALLTQSFLRTFGDKAAADLLTWMHSVESTRTELRELFELGQGRLESRLTQFREELRADIAELRQHTQADIATLRLEFADLRSDTQAGIATLRQEFADLRQDSASVRTELKAVQLEAAHVEGRMVALIERRYADGTRWAFVFWLTSTLTVAALILSRT